MKVLVLGSKGQLGRCLYDQLENTDYEVIYASREQIDITALEATKSKIVDISPMVVVNASAYTAVDKAEQDMDTAELINHIAVANIANVCLDLDCWFIHVSTDYVFDGISTTPYCEDDQTNPKGVYGDTKLKGELAIQDSGCKHIIFRTAWVFSEYGNNFLKTMLRLGSERDELSIVEDQIGCPTYAQDIAKSITNLLEGLVKGRYERGIYHYCGDVSCSWFEFAEEIFNQARIFDFSIPRSIKPVATCEYPTLAERPMFSVLDNRKGISLLGIYPSNWKKGIYTTLNRLK